MGQHHVADVAGEGGCNDAAKSNADSRADQAHDRAFRQEQLKHLAASGAQRTQNADFCASLGDSTGKGAVDDKQADEEREQASHVRHEGVNAQERIELVTSRGRYIHQTPGTEGLAQSALALVKGAKICESNTDAIETPAASQESRGR